MKLQTRTLADNALNFAVEAIQGWGHRPSGPPDYAGDWSLGMPILRDHRIGTVHVNDRWQGQDEFQHESPTTGVDQLEAGLRFYVVNYTGEEVEIPDAYCVPSNGVPA